MKRWYVVQVYAGYEEIVKADLNKRIEEEGMQDLFGQVFIPSTKMKQLFDVEEEAKDQQLFPGYILIEMEAVPQAIRLVAKTSACFVFLVEAARPIISKRDRYESYLKCKGEYAVPSSGHEFEVGKEVEIKMVHLRALLELLIR